MIEHLTPVRNQTILDHIRHAIYQMKDTYENVKQFLKNIWTFRKTLWHHRSWDADTIYYAIRDVADSILHRNENETITIEKHQVRKLKVVRELCTRLIEGNPSKYELTFFIDDEKQRLIIERKQLYDLPGENVIVPDHVRETEQRDLLFKIIKKNISHWWS